MSNNNSIGSPAVDPNVVSGTVTFNNALNTYDWISDGSPTNHAAMDTVSVGYVQTLDNVAAIGNSYTFIDMGGSGTANRASDVNWITTLPTSTGGSNLYNTPMSTVYPVNYTTIGLTPASEVTRMFSEDELRQLIKEEIAKAKDELRKEIMEELTKTVSIHHERRIDMDL